MSAPQLNRVIRLDSVPLEKASFTPEGYLRDKPVLTSTGIFEYKNPDGSVRRELRLPEDVFDPESLASYKGKPVIITHDAGLIDKSNVADESIGTILSEGERSGDDVRAEIIIHDTDAMKQSRLKELSLGYNLDLEETPGEWHGEKYDAIQRNIRINHLALVREARAGEQARLNIDGRDAETTLKGGKVMKKATHKNARRNDGVLSPEELKKAIEEYQASRAAKDSDDEEKPEVVETQPAPDIAPAPAVKEEKKQDADEPTNPAGEEKDKDIEDQVEEIKSRTDNDPDMQKLFDIIDTLLAERQFDEAEPEKAKEEGAEEELDSDDFEDKEEVEEDGADEDIPTADETEVKEDCGDENCDDMDDDIPDVDDSFVKPGEVMNADSVDAIVRARIDVGMVGKALNMDGLENMKLKDARKAVIKAVRPTMNLDGKSDAFINAAYSMARADIKSRASKDTNYQKRQMFGQTRKDSADVDTNSSVSARNRMIARHQNKNKEDK